MATRDNLLIANLSGEAWRLATERGDIAQAVAALRHISDRADLLAETAGVTAGSWLAHPGAHIGTELFVAGLCIYAGADLTEMEYWVRVGYDRGRRAHRPVHGTGF